MRFSLIGLAAVAALPQTSLAFEVAPGLTFSGTIEAERLSYQGDTLRFTFGEMELSFRTPDLGGVTLGFDMGIDSFRPEGPGGVTALFPTIVVGGSWGEISMGIPRLVMPEVFDTPEIGGSRMVGFVQSLYEGELIRFLTLVEAVDLRGIRYDGKFGNVEVAAAIHEVENGDVNLNQIALTYHLTNIDLKAGYASLTGDIPIDYEQIRLAATFDMGRFAGGVAGTRQTVNSVPPSSSESADTLEVYASFDVNDQLTVTGTYLRAKTSASSAVDTMAGLSADYSFNENIYLQVGAIDHGDLDDPIYDISLGLRF